VSIRVPSAVPTLLVGLLDDAAVFPPGSAPLPDAVLAHRRHRDAWYASMIGPLLVPAVDIGHPALASGEALRVGVVGDLSALPAALDRVRDSAVLSLAQIETPVAKRGADPLPGIETLLALLATEADGAVPVAYAETPLTWGFMAALDRLTRAREAGVPVVPKFRTGGLAAELFPTPMELAAVICACRDRDLPFKLTAGLHHAVRRTDPGTGLIHHGFLNVLAAAVVATGGAEPVELAEILGATTADPLVDIVSGALNRDRPLWIGFGTCDIADPLADLASLGLLTIPRGAGAAATTRREGKT
jgi:hypothetical protein